MATTLYLTNTASALGGAGQLALSTSRGSSSTTAITNTTTSGPSIPVTATAGDTQLSWWYQVGAGTISGHVTANVRGKESNTSANTGAGLVIDLYRADGSTLIGNLMTTTVPATISEYSTTDAAKALASIALTSQTAANGCWVKVTLTVRNVGTMASGYTVTNTYSGPTSGSAGDTYVTFASTLPAYVVAPTTLGPSSVVITHGTIFSQAFTSDGTSPTISQLKDTDCVLAWGLGEGTDTSGADASGHSRAATTSGSWSTGHTGHTYGAQATSASSGLAASYSGTLVATNGAFTLMCWHIPAMVTGGPDIISAGDGTHGVSAYWADSTHVTFATDFGGTYVQGASIAVSSGWLHVAIIVTGNIVSLYLNGQLSATLSFTGSYGTITALAAGESGYTQTVGVWNDVRVYSSALTLGDIQALMGTPVGVSSPLPGGLTLSSGTVSGTPTDSAGTPYSFTIASENAGGGMARTCTGIVGTAVTAPTTISPSSVAITHGTSFSQAFTADGTSPTISQLKDSDCALVWAFDEGAGSTFADKSGHGFTGTLKGAWTSSGHTGNAIKGTTPDSAGEYLGGSTILTTPTAFTIMGWFYPVNTSQTFLVLATDSSLASGTVGIEWSDSTHLQCWSDNGSHNTGAASTTTALNTWTHVAVTVTPSTLTLYLNGTPAASTARSGTHASFTYLTVGGDEAWAEYNFGSVDDIRVLGSALSIGDIQGLMATPVGVSGPLPTGLTLSSGTISGTPTDVFGTAYSFTIAAENSAGGVARTYSGTLAASSRWFLNTGSGLVALTPYLLTPGGLIQLE